MRKAFPRTVGLPVNRSRYVTPNYAAATDIWATVAHVMYSASNLNLYRPAMPAHESDNLQNFLADPKVNSNFWQKSNAPLLNREHLHEQVEVRHERLVTGNELGSQ